MSFFGHSPQDAQKYATAGPYHPPNRLRASQDICLPTTVQGVHLHLPPPSPISSRDCHRHPRPSRSGAPDDDEDIRHQDPAEGLLDPLPTSVGTWSCSSEEEDEKTTRGGTTSEAGTMRRRVTNGNRPPKIAGNPILVQSNPYPPMSGPVPSLHCPS